MTSAPTSDPARADEAQPDRSRWRALAVVMAAGAMTLLDVSIVNVALPTLREGLQADDSDVQWIVAGYALAFGIVLVPMGRLGDARSRRAVFMAGVALFTLASAAAGLAPNPTTISVARVVQGIGGGIITPQVSGFIQNLFQGRDRAKAFSIFGATIGLSTAAGPLLGGLLVQLGGPDFGWRLVFYVNVPIGIAVVLLARRLLPASAPTKRGQSLDPVGVLLFAAAVLLVLWPLVEGSQGTPLSSRPWWLLGVAAVLGIAFVLWERSWGGRGKETLINLRLLKVPAYVFGLSLGTFYFAGFTAIFLVVTLYLQVGLGYSALEAGLTTTPFAVAGAIAALLSGRLVERFGRWLAVFGLVTVSVGLLAIDLLVPHLSGMVGLKLAPAFLVAGFGGGFVITPNVTLTLAEVDPAEAGSGGGMLQTAQRVGSAIGVAVILAQFFSTLGSTRGDYAEALSVSLRTTIAAVVVALLFALADLLRRNRKEHHPEPQHAAEEAVPRHAA
ncbi:drug resistance transporter, EmrB/QacA subfamily [Microlunatus sagamiharensis]|uniref:Drug resistance transporter, EmrB/QacA subfamily n=1 Tax=Microlunatus sagamiharensis TaxID=546874 RepID=A0A1H2LH10_9ACTN|nr:MFS transporter [Microlunatus sagamiharensis]SDU80015.1 drug resistance transporter, EmrB/QacA subfamily [Microlunatus sagamiharensis]